MTQSIAGRHAPQLAVPYWIDVEGNERPPLTLKELGARHRLLFFYSIGAVAATRTDFQLSRRWFKIPAPRMSGSPQSRPHSRAPTSIRATSCPSTSSATASGFPSATRAVRRSVSIPRRWKTTAPAAQWFVAIDPDGVVLQDEFAVDVDRFIRAVAENGPTAR
jgi:hypothetical protein